MEDRPCSVLPFDRCPPRPLLAYLHGGSVRERPNQSREECVSTRPLPASVSAVVLTHRRPRLATAVVRSLVEQEGLPAERVVLVVNGSGGLEDPALEDRVRL